VVLRLLLLSTLFTGGGGGRNCAGGLRAECGSLLDRSTPENETKRAVLSLRATAVAWMRRHA